MVLEKIINRTISEGLNTRLSSPKLYFPVLHIGNCLIFKEGKMVVLLGRLEVLNSLEGIPLQIKTLFKSMIHILSWTTYISYIYTSCLVAIIPRRIIHTDSYISSLHCFWLGQNSYKNKIKK